MYKIDPKNILHIYKFFCHGTIFLIVNGMPEFSLPCLHVLILFLLPHVTLSCCFRALRDSASCCIVRSFSRDSASKVCKIERKLCMKKSPRTEAPCLHATLVMSRLEVPFPRSTGECPELTSKSELLASPSTEDTPESRDVEDKLDDRSEVKQER